MRKLLLSIACLTVGLAVRVASGDVPVTALTVDGQSLAGMLVAIDSSAIVINTGQTEQRIAPADLFEMGLDGSESDRDRSAPLLFLTSGDRLGVQIIRLRDDRLVCRWPESGEDVEFQIALETVLGIVLQPAAEARAERSLDRELQQREFQADVLFLSNGDRLTGVLEALNSENCRCATAVGSLEVNRSRVRAIGLNAALLTPAEPAEPEFSLQMTDGSWLTCRSVDWDGHSDVQVVTVTGADIPIPTSRLRSIRCYGPRVIPLSDLNPLEVEMTPYLSREIPQRRDRNVVDAPLMVRGESFAKGLGMHSRTTAMYSLNGEYSEFRAVVGIDDVAGGAGSVVFAVDVDGNRVFESGLVTGRDELLQVGPIDLRQADTMTLSVDYGTRGDIGDLADWCNPILVRSLEPED